MANVLFVALDKRSNEIAEGSISRSAKP